MPPRRVLRVRSRVVESNTSSPTAGSDSDVAAPPAAVVKMVEGNSASPITAFDQTGTSNSREQIPSDKCSPRKVWTGPPSVNGTAKLGEKASEDGQVPPEGEDPAVVAGVHDVMENVLVAIANGKEVTVKLKLDVEKPKADLQAKEDYNTRPKRKRNNLYSSLSLTEMNAIVEKRAKTYTEAPQSLRKQKASPLSGLKTRKKDVDPAVLDAENAAKVSNGKVPQEYLGKDGNLFYCRICLEVGEVVCCDGCPQVFHPSCVPLGLSKTSLDNDDDPWYCPDCVQKGMIGKSANQRKKKLQSKNVDSGEEKNASSSSPRHHRKRRMAYKKETIMNFPSVECSNQSDTSLIHPPCCPERVESDDHVAVDAKFGSKKNKSKNKIEECGGGERGSGKLGRSKGRGGRECTSNEGERYKRAFTTIGARNFKTSGYQSPFIEDEDILGPESLAFVEKPTGTIPAFFFFLMNNRNAIEKSLYKKNRAFRSMPKSVSRNQLVAEAGAAIWLRLTDRMKKDWIDISISDFEDRVVAWKQKEVIEAMIKEDELGHIKNEHIDKAEMQVTPMEDETHAADFRARTLQFSKVKTTLMKPNKSSNNNNVLLDLLQDCRFHPIRLMNSYRDQKDLYITNHSERAVEQFEVQGPLKTSIGDECMGCVRGWRHYCHILKHDIPKCSNRSALQPPMGTLSATRIGLGLKLDRHQENREYFKKPCPNYQSRVNAYLKDPSLRRDDVTTFIEDALAVKTLLPGPDDYNDGITTSKKQKRSSSPNEVVDESIEKRRYKCGHCSAIQYNPFGCIRCRREKLVKETASRNFISPSSISTDFLHRGKSLSQSHTYDEGYLKLKCMMLHHASNDVIWDGNSDGNTSKQRSEQLTKDNWTPNVILPPEQKVVSSKDLEDGNDVFSEIDDSSVISCSTSVSNDSSEARSLPADEIVDNTATLDSQNGTNKRRKSQRATPDPSDKRQLVAMKHKESANELSRKCLSIACSGIMMGMIRRDPLKLFAKPAPASMEEYHKVIKNPIDFQTMRNKLFSNEYATLGSFINDAKRLCINACIFNAADSLYALTAKQIYDSLLVMITRAQQWMTILKNTHASSFISNDDSDDGLQLDIFKNVESMWPGAAEILMNGSWLEQEAQADFVRTRENEIAYYGALSMRRAAISAHKSCMPVLHPVAKRSHIEDEMLRDIIDCSVSCLNGPACLKDHPDWREEQLLQLLKTVQRHRVENHTSSESGCARCDATNIKRQKSESISMLHNNAKTMPDTTNDRVDLSRTFQSTGLSSRNARDASSGQNDVANEAMISVKGSRIHGWGLFADSNFKQGELVAEYVGEYISNAVADRREKYYRKQRIQDYQFRVNDKIVIDATLKGGYARYINHSCQPNCKAKIIESEPPNLHLMRVMIIAKRDIAASEELTYDYHFPLETDLKKRVPCSCCSENCRGYMNWDIPEKMKKWRASRSAEGKGRVNSKKNPIG